MSTEPTRPSPATAPEEASGFWRTLVFLLVSFATVAIGIVGWFPAQQRDSALAALEENTVSYAELVAHSLAPAVEFGDQELIDEVFRGASRHDDFIGARLVGADGQVLGTRGDPSLDARDDRMVARAPVELGSGDNAHLALVMSTARIERASERNLWVAIGFAAVVLLLGGVVSVRVARSRQLSDRARRAAEEANEVKSRFLANISHELRTPLNGVLGLADALLRQDLPGGATPLVRTIDRSARTLLALVNELLDLTRVESGALELEETDVDPEGALLSVADVFQTTCRERGVELIVQVDPNVPETLTLDPLRFEQVLSNLIGNAVKFTSEGQVKATLRWREHGGTPTLEVAVEDTGVGIPEEKLALIFRAFSQADTSTTRKYGGTGLGLAISSQLVELMGGGLKVESRIGEGSRFWFEIPGTDPKPPPAPTPIAAKRALLISSHPEVRAHLTMHCERIGLEHDALAPEELVNRLDASSDEMAVIVWDGSCELPSDVVEAIGAQRRRRKLAFVVYAASAEADSFEWADPTFLPRPFSRRGFEQRIAHAVGRAQGKTEALPTSERHAHIDVPRLAHVRLLVAEDNDTNQLVIRTFLEELGVEPTMVSNGREAVEALTSGARFDAVLMDCQMPLMDGYEATQRIRAWEARSKVAATPIIAVTAHALAAERERALNAGMDGYLTKPIELRALLAALHDHAGIEDSASLAEPAVSSNEEFLDKLAATFARTSRASLERLGEIATQGGDLAKLTKEAHSLKGACLSVGASNAAEAARALEIAAREGRSEELGALVIELEIHVEEAADELRERARSEQKPLENRPEAYG